MKTLLTLALSLISLQLLAQYFVGHTTVTFNDPSRTGGFGSGGGAGRQIQTEIYYPATSAGDNVPLVAGEHPVIVFGHGFAMSWDAYSNIWERYAAMGYILAFPRTEGSLFPAPSHNDFGLDLKLVGEKMIALGDLTSSLFYNKVKNAVAIMGHSMGGGATMLAASSNVNIKGIVGMAPAETDPSAVTASSGITVPALIFSGSSDGVTPPSAHHQPIYNAITSGCKSFVSIIGGAHCYFANSNFNCDFGEGTSSTGISITRAEQQTRTYSVLDPWLDYILMEKCSSYSAYQDALVASPATLQTQSTCPSNPTPVVQENGGILNSSVTGVGYQWYLNGNEIVGANQQNYTPLVNGDYSVLVLFADGCETSAPLTVFSLAIDAQELQDINIYPNPTSGNVSIGNGDLGEIQVQVFDVYGNLLSSIVTERLVNLNKLSIGVYFLKTNFGVWRVTKN